MCVIYSTGNGNRTGENEFSESGWVGVEAIGDHESVDLFQSSMGRALLP